MVVITDQCQFDYGIQMNSGNLSGLFYSFSNFSNISYNAELKQYKNSHRNRINIGIHYFTVPCEVLSSLILISLVRLELVWIITLIIIFFLVLTESKAKYFTCVLHILLGLVAAASNYLFTYVILLEFSILLQLFAWFFQIVIGHYLIEGNSPSMMKGFTIYSVVVSLLLALDC